MKGNTQSLNQDTLATSNTSQITPVKAVHRNDFYQQPSNFGQTQENGKQMSTSSNDGRGQRFSNDWYNITSESDSPDRLPQERLFQKNQNLNLSNRIDLKGKELSVGNSSTASNTIKYSIKEMNDKLQDLLMINPKERVIRKKSKSIKQARTKINELMPNSLKPPLHSNDLTHSADDDKKSIQNNQKNEIVVDNINKPFESICIAPQKFYQDQQKQSDCQSSSECSSDHSQNQNKDEIQNQESQSNEQIQEPLLPQDQEIQHLELKQKLQQESKINQQCKLSQNVRIGDLLGEGAYGQVFKALNLQDGNFLAVKVMKIPNFAPGDKKSLQTLSKLEKEITLLKNLKHKNIVQYYDSCITNNNEVNIYMEFMPGGSLQSLVKQYGAFDECIIKNFTKQLLEGLDFLHSNHVIHADLKGANILFDGKENIKLSDFGAARYIENLPLLSASQSDICSSIKGSLYWMAPEMIMQQGYGRKIDIWSLGCTLIEMATGKHPWPEVKNYPQLVIEIVNQKTPSIPEFLSPQAQDFIKQCLQYDKKLRPRPKALLYHPFITQKEEQV